MRTRKSSTVIGCMLLLVALLAAFSPGCAPSSSEDGAGKPAGSEAEYVWRFACPWIDITRNESSALLCDLINYYSDGRIYVEFHGQGVLGPHDEEFHAMQTGDVEMGIFCPYGSLVPGGTINWMNWTVENWDEAGIAYSPDGGILFEMMTDAWAEVGAHLLAEYQLGPYGLGNNVRPIKTPDDFKNLKFRVGGTTSYIRCMENMGEGTGLTLELLPWVELYGSLEKGVVDGCWSLWASLVEDRQYEVLKYYTALGFGWDTNQVLINKELWDGLPADLQDVVTRASRIAEQRDYAAHRMNEIRYKEFLLDAGLEIYTLTPEERDLFRQKANMPAVWAEVATPYLDEHYPGQDMTEKLQDELTDIKARVAAMGRT